MAPIIQVDDKTLKTLNPEVYTLRNDLEEKSLQIAELDKSNWIVVPKKQGNKFIKDSFAFDVSPARISYSPAVEKVGKELKINYQNSSKDSLGRGFVGNNNWKESLMLNQFLGVKTPSLRQKLDYLHLLYLGSQNKINVYDISGKKIDSKLCEKLLMDTIKVQDPWRAEWIDADYKIGKKGLEIHYDDVFNKNGKIINYNSEVLSGDTLMEDKQVNAIDYITKNHTSQGQISKKVKSGNFYSWYPKADNNSVAGFVADSDGALLYCDWLPSYWGASLGVCSVAIRE